MEEKYRIDPLLLCLITLTKLDKRPASAEALIEGLPFDPKDDRKRLFSLKSSNANFSRAAGRAGFKSTLQKRPLNAIPSLVLPAILILRDDNACVLTEIDQENAKAVVIIPSVDESPMEIDLEELEKEYLGYVFFLKRQYEGVLQANILNETEIKAGKNWFFSTLFRFKDIYFKVIIASLFINIFVIDILLII